MNVNDDIMSIFENKNKDVYSGDLKNGKKHGFGVCYYSYGAIYIGEWVDNKREGIGKCIYPNGTIYKGDWKNVPEIE